MPGLFTETGMDHDAQVLEIVIFIIIIVVVVVVVVVSCHKSFPPCTSLEPTVTPPPLRLQFFPYYV